MNHKKVLIGISGGVDSTVSALLLKEHGYEVVGATMLLWGDQNNSNKIIEEAKKACQVLQIPHYVLDFRKEFKTCVINNFIETYRNGETPNPCIQCNKHMKFGLFYEKAKELGCEYISTGHYAKTEFSEKYNQYVLKKSNSGKKDQSYVLYNIPSEMISKVIFPLGDFENKEQIKEIAKKHGLTDFAEKKESQEICFVPNNDYAKFLLDHNEKSNYGNIVAKTGKVLGKHKGLINYTIGQRKGLEISNKVPLFVTKIDIQKNELVVGEEPDIYSKELIATNINYILKENFEKFMEIKAKIRYNSKEANAELIQIDKNTAKIIFKEAQRSITPGQSVVFYLDDIVLGGGTIC